MMMIRIFQAMRTSLGADSSSKNSRDRAMVRQRTKRLDPSIRMALAASVEADVGRLEERNETHSMNDEHDQHNENASGVNQDSPATPPRLDDDHTVDVGPSVQASTSTAVWDEIRSIDTSLMQAQTLLKDSLRKEQFLGVRIAKYRQNLDHQARQIKAAQEQLQSSYRSEGDNTTETNALFAIPMKQTQIGLFIADSTTDVADYDSALGQSELGRTPTPVVDRGSMSLCWDAAEVERQLTQWKRDTDLLDNVRKSHKTIVIQCETIRRKICDMEKKRDDILSSTDNCRAFLLTAQEQQPTSSAVAGATLISSFTTGADENVGDRNRHKSAEIND
jgi:hypothetical protein